MSWKRRDSLDHLDRLSPLLGTVFHMPATRIRFGAFLRLVPRTGDAAASALSCWLLFEAYQLGLPRSLFARMIANAGRGSGRRSAGRVGFVRYRLAPQPSQPALLRFERDWTSLIYLDP